MGDHRASIKMSFEMHGHKQTLDMYINWYPADDGTGVDRRVTEWFAAQAEIAMGRWDDMIAEERRQREEREGYVGAWGRVVAGDTP